MQNLIRKIPVAGYASGFKVFWDVFVILTILSSSIVFSYRLTFGRDVLDAAYWIFTSLYALDLLIGFNTSIRVRLETISDRREITRAYLRGWFTVDLLAAIPFTAVLEILFPRGAGMGPGLLVVSTVLRLLRLTKLAKVNSLFRDLQEDYNINPGVMRLVTFAFMFIQSISFMALGWCLIGASEQSRSALDQFIRALYWCTTTIATIGYGDYYPDHEKNLQIIYTICVQIVGVGMYGYIIGNVSSLIVNIDVAKAAFSKRMEEINNFMRTRRVPAPLQQRVKGYYAYLWETRKSAASGSMLEGMPHTLTVDISLFLNRGIIEKVALFKDANEIFIREVVQLLHSMVFLPNDYIIRQGEYGDCMYFLSSGDVEVLVGEQKVAQLGAGSPFGEAALLQGEKRNASVRALSYCDVYRLSRADFDTLRGKYPEFDARVRKILEDRLKDTRQKVAKPKRRS
jgi:voltage-gated potassium channel